MGDLIKANVLVVVVTYNRADVTSLMLESLKTARNESSFNLFLVDNCSQDDEYQVIKRKFDELFREDKENTCLLNSSNSGYSAANNLGLLHAFKNSSKYTHICLLNNDTIVTDSWLDRLIGHKVNGLVGPVSNSVGNDQLIPLFYDLTANPQELKKKVNDFSKLWFEAKQGHIVATQMLGFFCVLGPLDVFQKIGLLDENFGIGTFEDDDYCVRASQLGYDLIIARDVFLHHWGSASFSKLSPEVSQKLNTTNRAYYEKKHNKAWKGYSTTLIDGYKSEIAWQAVRPNDYSKKTIDLYENYIRSQMQENYDRIIGVSK